VSSLRPKFYKICLLALASLVPLVPPVAHAKDGEREPRELRDVQRAAEREARDLAELQERELKEAAQSAEREISDSSGGDSGSGSSGSGSDSSGSGSGSGDSGSDSSGSGSSGSGDDGDGDDSDNSGSGSSSGSGSRSGGRRVMVERDSRGGDHLRDEVLMIGQASEIDAVRRAGHPVFSERRLESMQRSMVRVRVREGQSVDRVIAELRQIVPGARIAPNHVFRPSGVTPALRAAPGTVISNGNRADLIGVIDTGVDSQSSGLQIHVSATRGFAPGGYVGRSHGTVVAKIAAQRGANLAIADVFGLDQRNALAASAEYIAAGVDWLRGQNIRVINISIEGPRNLVLEYVIEQAVAAGTAIVAAAGNGGPASQPAFPGAYPGVIAVTAVDQSGRVYRRAARGPHIQFAAQGVFAKEDNRYSDAQYLAGTSFAAPAVAADLAWRWSSSPRATREQVVLAMRADVTDMGNPGRDPIYGWGVISTQPVAPLSGRSSR
jgi:minor extracellular protease Epr